MPLFEYICKECEHEFEALVFGKQKAACPKCQSQKLEPQLSVFAVAAKSRGTKSGADAQPSMPACGSCGDPRGLGACSIKDLDHVLVTCRQLAEKVVRFRVAQAVHRSGDCTILDPASAA